MPAKRVVFETDDPLNPDPFPWFVFESGYAWKRCVLAPTWTVKQDTFAVNKTKWAGALVVRDQMSQCRLYSPLAIPELFREFAETRLSPDAILAFANKYGQLTINPRRRDPTRNLDQRRWPQTIPEFGELHSNWVEEISALRRASRLWDALRKNDLSEVAKWVHLWRERTDSDSAFWGAAETQIDDDNAWLFVELGDSDETIRLWWSPALIGPGDHSRCRRVMAWRSLLLSVGHHLREHCGMAIEARNETDTEFSLRPAPKNLLGAMWWQLARAIAGEARYVKCKWCKRRIELSTGEFGSRSDRQFCSSSCKFKDHRKQVKKAKAMKAQGRTVTQIAKTLRTSTETIKNWLWKKK
jgi:hypothetical protein